MCRRRRQGVRGADVTIDSVSAAVVAMLQVATEVV